MTIRNTIGIRRQSNMPQEMAIEMAACTAQHRDISLYF
jgi:hypothetical protein